MCGLLFTAITLEFGLDTTFVVGSEFVALALGPEHYACRIGDVGSFGFTPFALMQHDNFVVGVIIIMAFIDEAPPLLVLHVEYAEQRDSLLGGWPSGS